MFKTLFSIGLIATLGACGAPPVENVPGGDGFVSVTDQAAFASAVVDRRLSPPANPDRWFMLNSDGAVTGEFGRGPVVGTWEFVDGYWCREFSAGVGSLAYDCQSVELSGSTVRLTRDRGAGDAGVFDIQ